MSSKVPASHVDLLTGPYFAVLTTVAPSGQPENTVVWCSWDGEHVLVNTADGRRKPANVRNNPKVALTVIDPQDPFRWIDVRGEVAEIVPDPEYANINAHAKLYAGVDEYYGGVSPIELKGKEDRIIFKIRPDRVLAFPG
ncbi:MAG: PPOX class F420-dependent oxidoreductase [Caldilinea sp.]|nr:PPOX class F420-dependent oxidoreductase [Caldilinea sp.]MCB0060354.1 PPOX class F420-dependent oxidoreductase [Caldilineaceae bacterium]MCB0043069.1 PPOX class F420-dependent oxidoreductase [Caldilinea sp.]MCB9117655.1 PPOX class F420-dependent oxidoreductase [Caldilineaceae bacterium]MCB9121652.1 PPOX class F420-dependent oxidoreductase [Caldilineaceae bacterium]